MVRGRGHGGFMQNWFSEKSPEIAEVGFQNVSKDQVCQPKETVKLVGTKQPTCMVWSKCVSLRGDEKNQPCVDRTHKMKKSW